MNQKKQGKNWQNLPANTTSLSLNIGQLITQVINKTWTRLCINLKILTTFLKDCLKHGGLKTALSCLPPIMATWKTYPPADIPPQTCHCYYSGIKTSAANSKKAST